ncbi:MAG: ribosome recycling factor [Acidobacteriota bacterium]
MLDQIHDDASTRMGKTLENLQHELATIRTGRASLAILDAIRVDYYGTPGPLNQVAKLSVPEASLIVIQPWDPALIGDIEKAIRSSDLGLNPTNDGKLIRLPIPPLTAERRAMLIKRVHTLGEETKGAVRHIRRDANDAVKKLQKEGKISQDDEHRAYDRIQKLTDERCGDVDGLIRHKDAELKEV